MTKQCTDFFIFTSLNTYVPLIFHAKIQLKISSGSGKEVYFVVFAIFSNGGQLDLTQFYNSQTLESGHAPCEICQQLVQCFREKVV